MSIRLLEFGDFSLDTSQRILLREGKRVPLSPRPFAMLLMLVENRHRIVFRDELMEQVWAGVIVEESNIATNIARLRRVLANGQHENGAGNGKGEARQYIETISGYGYQFVAEVREREVEENGSLSKPQPELPPVQLPAPEPRNDATPLPPPAPPSTVVPPPRPLPFYQNRRYLTGLAAMIVVAALVWPLLRPKPPFIDPSKIIHREVISWKNRFGDPRLLIRPSPDGRMVAYAKSETDQPDIFIQEVGRRIPVRVTTDAWPDTDPIWSPDGKQIAYQSNRGNTIELAVVDLLTRQRNVACTFDRNNIRLLRWSRKTPRLFYTDEKNVFAFSLDSQATVNLTNFKEEQGGPRQFGLSLDEEKIAYVRTVNGKGALLTARLDGRDTVQLIHAGEGVEYPEWFADNEHIVYSSRHGDSLRVSVIAPGGYPIPLTTGREATILQYLSPAGGRIFYSVNRVEGDFFRCEVQTGAETELVVEPGLKAWLDVAPDGRTLAFQRAESVANLLRSTILSASLETQRLPVELAADGFDPRWSPDGERLAFLRQAGGGYQLWLVVRQDITPRLLTEGVAMQQGFMGRTLQWQQPCNYSWSPDGSQLAYPTRNAGVTNVVALSADGKTKVARSQNADPALKLVSPLWSPDGIRLAHLAQTALTGKAKRSLIINDGQRDRTIWRTDLPVRMIGWADGAHLLAGVMEPANLMVGALTLKRITLAGGEAQEMIGESLPIYFNSVRLSPDGRMLAFTARQDDCDNVWLYALDTRQLRKLTANKETHLHLTGLNWLPDGKAICFSKQSTATSIWAMENFN